MDVKLFEVINNSAGKVAWFDVSMILTTKSSPVLFAVAQNKLEIFEESKKRFGLRNILIPQILVIAVP